MAVPKDIKKLSSCLWEIPASHKPAMRVPARIYATRPLLEQMDEGVFDQITNVAMLPGIVESAFCMPDGHWGYGFPIGGMAPIDAKTGVISPGGIGFDINCGMRLVRTSLTIDQVQPHLTTLIDRLFKRVPPGLGAHSDIKLGTDEFCDIAEQGAKWCLKKGFCWTEDLDRTEENGCCQGADPATVSHEAIERARDQVGTLGSGNHYLEIQVARPENIFDIKLAHAFGIDIPNQVVIMFHCGSRGFGHQIATDYLKSFLKVMTRQYGIEMPDRELACAPIESQDGRDYFSAMKCAVNMAFANRQVILHRIREVFSDVLHRDPADLGMSQVYDVCHNIARLETHQIAGQDRLLLIHRKGATRTLPPGSKQLPEIYRGTGQPVIIGGSMETGSYLLAGSENARQSFYTTAHGSGRVLSRRQARRSFNGGELIDKMKNQGIYIRCTSKADLAEEAGAAYKNIDEVVKATAMAGISKPVARFIPIGNIKG